MSYTYNFIAYDSQGNLLPSAVGSFYADTDSALVNPLTVTTQDGVTTSSPTSNRSGLVYFTHDTEVRGYWKSGANTLRVSAWEAADAAAAAAAAAQAAAEAAASAASAPTDEAVTNVFTAALADSTSGISQQLAAKYVPGPESSLGFGQLPYQDPTGNVGWSASTAVIAATLTWKIATDPAYGADPTGATDSTSALQACLDAAQAAGTTAYFAGTFAISGTLNVACDLDAGLAAINYTGTGLAMQVGLPTGQLFRRMLLLPELINVSKTGLGWAQVAGSAGIELANVYGCLGGVAWRRVNNFEVGARFTGVPTASGIQGTQHVTLLPGQLDNNKVNLQIAPHVGTSKTDSGWANQVTVVGGRMSHNSNEGSQVVGTRQVQILNCPNIVNGWNFYGTSLETPDVAEYHVECAGQNIKFDGCRWENTGGDAHRRIWNRGSAKNNQIVYGFNAGQVTQINDPGALSFALLTDTLSTFTGGTTTTPVVTIENSTSSTAPALVIMGAGAGAAGSSTTTAYAVTASSQSWRGKRPTDTNDRLIMDYLNGRVYVGDGTFTPAGYLSASASGLFVGGSVPLFPLVTNTQDLGLSTLKWRYVRAGTAVQTGAVATGSRPAASTAGAGAMVYDTTLNKPIWSDGSSWRDATGTVV